MHVHCKILEMDIPGELCTREQGIPECAGCVELAQTTARAAEPRADRPESEGRRPMPPQRKNSARSASTKEQVVETWRRTSTSAESARLLEILAVCGRSGADGKCWISSPLRILGENGVPEARARMFLAFCLHHKVIARSSTGWHEITLKVTSETETVVHARQERERHANDASTDVRFPHSEPPALPAGTPKPIAPPAEVAPSAAPSKQQNQLRTAERETLRSLRADLVAQLVCIPKTRAPNRQPLAVPEPDPPAPTPHFETDIGFALADGRLYARERAVLRMFDGLTRAELKRWVKRDAVRTLEHPDAEGCPRLYYLWEDICWENLIVSLRRRSG